MSTRMHHLRQTVAESKASACCRASGRRSTGSQQRAACSVSRPAAWRRRRVSSSRARTSATTFSFGGFGSDSGDRIELTRRAIERGSVLLGEPLDPRQVLVVGDTPHDVEAAHGAGAVAVGVATGHFDAKAAARCRRGPCPGLTRGDASAFARGGNAVTDTLCSRTRLRRPPTGSPPRQARAEQIALTGGSTPRLAYERLAAMDVDWSDARCGSAMSAACLQTTSAPTSEWCAMPCWIGCRATLRTCGGSPASWGRTRARRRTRRELRAAFGEGIPRFDLMLLGLGPDGHCASLFPGDPALEERERLAVGVARAGPAPWVPRVTLTLPVLNAARHVLFLVMGADKAAATARAFGGGPDRSVPASLVAPTDGTLTVLIDRSARGAAPDQPLDHLGRELLERRQHARSLGERLPSGSKLSVRDRDHAHPGGSAGEDAVVRVLDRGTTGRLNFEAAGCLEIDVRRGLATRHLLGRHRRPEIAERGVRPPAPGRSTRGSTTMPARAASARPRSPRLHEHPARAAAVPGTGEPGAEPPPLRSAPAACPRRARRGCSETTPRSSCPSCPAGCDRASGRRVPARTPCAPRPRRTRNRSARHRGRRSPPRSSSPFRRAPGWLRRRGQLRRRRNRSLGGRAGRQLHPLTPV